MNRFFFIVILFTLVGLHGQVCGEIEYTFETNVDRKRIEQFNLKFNNKEAYCEEHILKKQKSEKETETEPEIETTYTDEGMPVVGQVIDFTPARRNWDKRFFYNTGEDFYFRVVLGDETVTVKEDPFDWRWQLHDETKKIARFNCQKAAIEFRGRHYTAWLTNEIPVPFGPWKFQGLGGLILEVYDDDNIFHIYSNQISIGKNSCAFNTPKLNPEELLNITTYLKKQDDYIEDVFAKMHSRLPKILQDQGINPSKILFKRNRGGRVSIEKF